MSNTPAPTYDPCAAFARLRDAYQNVVAGQTVRSVRYKNGEEERQTDFTPANIEELRRAMNEARDQCAASMGMHTRSAIGFGGPRRPLIGGM